MLVNMVFIVIQNPIIAGLWPAVLVYIVIVIPGLQVFVYIVFIGPGLPGWTRIAGLWPVVLVYMVFIRDPGGLQVFARFGRSCWST